jgi:acetyl/propionyl-CoA carboxylase alpha subunit
VLADKRGHLICLGERAGVLQHGNQRIIAESPASGLTPEQRERLCSMALDLAHLVDYQGLGAVEFLVDEAGQFYFTEIKPRIQVEHPLSEMVTRVDLVREQIRIAAGEPLALEQGDVEQRGCAMMCRVNAEDPWNRFLPSPGVLRQVRLPGGPEVRVDTYVYSHCSVPGQYDPLIAKVLAWGADRDQCEQRLRRALRDMQLVGTPTTLPLLQRVLRATDFTPDIYSAEFLMQPFDDKAEADLHRRNLAAAAAVFYVRRNQLFRPSIPARLMSGWHRETRRLS